MLEKEIIDNPDDNELSKSKIKLNRLEHYLLKLVIPFVRIGHCTRGMYLKLSGELIMVSAELVNTIEKILPIKQNILPVNFKRKLEYTGYYISECVDKNKVMKYFEFLKKYNHLYEDIELHESNLDKFDKATQDDIPDTDKGKPEEDQVSLESEQIPMSQSSIIQDKYKECTNAPTVANQMANMIYRFENIVPIINNDEEIDDPQGVIYHEDEADKSEETNQFLETLNNLDIELEDEKNLEIVSELKRILEQNLKDSNHYCSLIKNLSHLLQNQETLEKLNNTDHDNDKITNLIQDILRHTEKDIKDTQIKLKILDKCSHNEKHEGSTFFDEILEINRKEILVETKQFVKNQVKKIQKNLEDNIISIAPGEYGHMQFWGSNNVFLEEKMFPQLFPFGIGGYLSSNLLKSSNMGFSNYCKNRLLSVDSKYRRDPAYLFFLLTVKELLEMKRSEKTYFRKASKLPCLTPEILSSLSPEFFKRYNSAFTTFKHLRGTAFYYQDVKKRLMAFLRQKGGPTLFATFSAAEFEWDHLALKIYETITKKPSTIEYIQSQSISWRNKLIQDNVVQSTIHFSKRMDKIIAFLNSKPLLVHNGVKYKVASYFYRIEFQVLLWSTCNQSCSY